MRCHFVFCTGVRRRYKEAINVSGITTTHLAASFGSTWGDVIENDIFLHFLAD